jgi:uncharacterized SAM-binding protein YcdF (DUF218 family)
MKNILFFYWVKPWLLPPGLNFLIILIGLMCRFYFRRIGFILMTVGITSLLAFSLPIVVYPFINILQDQFPALTENSLKNSQPKAIVVLGGGGSTIKHEYNDTYQASDFTSARIDYAVFLHNKTHLPIILSGGKQSPFSLSEGKIMSEYLYRQYHLTPLFLEESSINTEEESKNLAFLLKQKNINNIYLVTHAIHMPRSVFIFKCAGINVTPAPMGYITYGPGYSFLSFFPNSEALYNSYFAIHEYIGMLWYHIRYESHCIL